MDLNWLSDDDDDVVDVEGEGDRQSINVISVNVSGPLPQVSVQTSTQFIQLPPGYFAHTYPLDAFAANDVDECRRWMQDAMYEVQHNLAQVLVRVRTFKLFELIFPVLLRVHANRDLMIKSLQKMLLVTNINNEDEFLQCLQLIVPVWSTHGVKTKVEELYVKPILCNWKRVFDFLVPHIFYFTRTTESLRNIYHMCIVQCRRADAQPLQSWLSFKYVFEAFQLHLDSKLAAQTRIRFFFEIFNMFAFQPCGAATCLFDSFVLYFHKELLMFARSSQSLSIIRSVPAWNQYYLHLQITREFLSIQLNQYSAIHAQVIEELIKTFL
jgi:hypothetical protein